MFRKREDSLFDTADATHGVNPAADNLSAAQPQAAAPAPVVTQPQAAQPIINRGMPEARPAPQPQSAPQASAFRPSPSQQSQASQTNDLNRARMPEAKLPPLPSSLTPSLTPANKSARRVLTVGHDILLKGEIATCDRLVIEGKVDATLNDVHTVEIAETGSFKGSAHIEDAEISGLFEGDLTVRGLLVIRATGRVRGKISFGEIEIERGGEISGEVKIAGTQSQRPVRPATPTKESVAA